MIHEQGDSLGKAEQLITVGNAQMTMQQLCNEIVQHFTGEFLDEKNLEKRTSLLRYLRKIENSQDSFIMSEVRCPSDVMLKVPRHEPESFTEIPLYPHLSKESEIHLRGHSISIHELIEALVQNPSIGQADPRVSLLKDLRNMQLTESAMGSRFEISASEKLGDLRTISFQRFLDS